MIDSSLIPALTRFLEANQAIERDRKLAKPRRQLQKAVSIAFGKQVWLFLRSLKQLKSRFDDNAERLAETAALRESVSPADWLPLWDAATRDTKLDLTDPLQAAILDVLILGGGDMIAELGLAADDLDDLGISWSLENPRAVLYAQQQAAAQVAKINDTTRSYLNSMISQAATEGWSYDRLSDAIGDRFKEFATGGDNPRSKRIAVYELGDAYEAGNEMAARELVDAGLKLQKKWLTAGDDRVRPSHVDNQAEGWIGLDDNHSSGDNRPPTDPGCRCAELYRRKK